MAAAMVLLWLIHFADACLDECWHKLRILRHLGAQQVGVGAVSLELTLQEGLLLNKLGNSSRLGTFLWSISNMFLELLLEPHNAILVVSQLLPQVELGMANRKQRPLEPLLAANCTGKRRC